jgi:hypothetical protein
LEVHAHDTGEALWLDPESRFLRDPRTMIAGMTAVRCVGGGEIIRVPQATPVSNQSSLELTLSLDDEGKLVGEGSASMRGIFSPYYSVKGLKNETEEFAKNKVEGMFPAASLKSWNIRTLDKERVEIGFSIEAELPQATAQGRLYLTLPEPFMADLSGTDRVHIERSEYPVPLRVVPCGLSVSVTFESLPGWELLGNPLHADERNAVGHVKTATEREFSGPEPKLRLTRSLVIEKEIVTGERYPDLRSLLLKYGESQIILTKSGD